MEALYLLQAAAKFLELSENVHGGAVEGAFQRTARHLLPRLFEPLLVVSLQPDAHLYEAARSGQFKQAAGRRRALGAPGGVKHTCIFWITSLFDCFQMDHVPLAVR